MVTVTPSPDLHPPTDIMRAFTTLLAAASALLLAVPAQAFTPPSEPPTTSSPPSSTMVTVTRSPAAASTGPASTGYTFHPNNNEKKCLDVRGAKFENGTPVQIYDCNGTKAQKWYFGYGRTNVVLAGTNFCLDAGSKTGNGVEMKIWTCYDGLPAQTWFYTNDNRIALEGRGLCLDLAEGKLDNSNKVQTWQCTDHNKNQVWNSREGRW